MRGGNLIWGLLLVVLGALLLLQQLGYIYIQWWELWQYWPLILIAWGVMILPIHRAVRTGVALVIFAVVLVLLLGNFDFRYAITTKSSESIALHHYSEPMEGPVDQVQLSMRLFAGDFSLEDTTGELVDVTTRGRKSSFGLMASDAAELKSLTLNINEAGRDWGRSRSEVSAKISLNTYPQWILSMDAGSADLDLDLRPYKVSELSAKMHSANGSIRLGEGNLSGKFQMNSCNLKIRFPKQSGFEIIWVGTASHSDLKDFEEVEDGVFHSENWEGSVNKIRLNITSNSSSINIEPY